MKNKNYETADAYDYLAHSASSQDCTGLIPIPTLSPEEVEHYEEIYPFLPPQTLNLSKGKDI